MESSLKLSVISYYPNASNVQISMKELLGRDACSVRVDLQSSSYRTAGRFRCRLNLYLYDLQARKLDST